MRGTVTPRQVAAISLTLLCIGIAVLATFNAYTILIAAAMVAGLATYTFFKRRWWGGPLWNSWIVALLPLLTYLIGSRSTRPWSLPPELLALMASTFFTYGVFVILGYFKDVSADRSAGYRTIVVRFGWHKAVYVDTVITLLGIGASVTAILLALSGGTAAPGNALFPLAVVVWVLGSYLLILANFQLLRIPDRDDKAYKAIGNVVRGFILLHGAEVIFFNPALAGVALLVFILFEFSLRIRPEPTQI